MCKEFFLAKRATEMRKGESRRFFPEESVATGPPAGEMAENGWQRDGRASGRRGHRETCLCYTGDDSVRTGAAPFPPRVASRAFFIFFASQGANPGLLTKSWESSRGFANPLESNQIQRPVRWICADSVGEAGGICTSHLRPPGNPAGFQAESPVPSKPLTNLSLSTACGDSRIFA